MRFRFLLVCVSAGLISGGFAIQACGGTEETTDAIDSGTDAPETGIKDSSLPDVKDSAPACDPNADVLADIPDASIADGATTSGICVGCVRQKCKSEVDECAANCKCQTLASGALKCYLKNQANPLSCIGSFVGTGMETQSIGLALVTCIQSDCKAQCAADAFNPDAGDAGDADAN